jgi:translation initiation factor 2 subunit 2
MENEQDYEKLLEEAYRKIKPVESKIERFEVPKVEGHIEGTKTIITNFKQVCDYIRRDCSHVIKFLLKELASPGVMRGDRLIITRAISSKPINEKIQKYVEEFVICRECKKPDTEFMKQDRILFIRCLACGAKHSLGTGI